MTIFELIEFSAQLIVILAALAGGGWAIFRYHKLREAKRALTVSLSTQLFSIDETVVVEVTVNLSNTGTIPIYGTIDTTRNCLLYIKKVLPSQGTRAFFWNDDEMEFLIDPVPYLKYYDNCILEPGVPCEVKGYATLQTTYQGLLLLFAEFCDTSETYWGDWKIIDTRIVNRDYSDVLERVRNAQRVASTDG